MSLLRNPFGAGPADAARRPAPRRRRLPSLESLEGRALLTLNFTSAFGVGGDVVFVNAVAVDPVGDTYITGRFKGLVDFDPKSTSGASIVNGGVSESTFVAKYSPTNDFSWVRTFSNFAGGSNEGNGIALDNPHNSIVVAGTLTGSANFSPTGAPVILTSDGGSTGYVAVLTPTGDLSSGLATKVDVPHPGSMATSTANSVTVDPDGTNIYIAGDFTGTVDFDSSGSTITRTSHSSKLTDSYALRLTSNLGPTGFAQGVNQSDITAHAIAVDTNGSVYVVGEYNSGVADTFVVKYTTDGQSTGPIIDFGGAISGGHVVMATDVVTDSANNVYIAGYFEGTGVNFDSGFGTGTVAIDSLGSFDAFVIKLNPTLGQVTWAKRFGSVNHDEAAGLAIDGFNNLYVTGYFDGTATAGTTGQGTAIPDLGTYIPYALNAYVLELDSGDGSIFQSNGATSSGGSSGFTLPTGVAVNASGVVVITGAYETPANIGGTDLPTAGTLRFFVATLGASTQTPTTPTPTPTTPTPTPTTPTPTTPTPTPTPTPTTPTPAFISGSRVTSGRGKKAKLTGEQLFFTAPLNSHSAQFAGNYHITQRIGKKQTKTVPVLSATYNSANNSVMLVLGRSKAGKPLQLTIAGLVGANNAAVSTIVTGL